MSLPVQYTSDAFLAYAEQTSHRINSFVLINEYVCIGKFVVECVLNDDEITCREIHFTMCACRGQCINIQPLQLRPY